MQLAQQSKNLIERGGREEKLTNQTTWRKLFRPHSQTDGSEGGGGGGGGSGSDDEDS